MLGSQSLVTELLTVALILVLNAVIVYLGYRLFRAFQNGGAG